MHSVTIRDISFQVNDARPGFWRQAENGNWEKPTYDILDACVDEDTVCLDFGAWVGPTVLYEAQRARKVIAFEPDPTAADELEANLALNPAFKDKVTVIRKAVWTQSGSRKMAAKTAPGDSMSSFVHKDASVTFDVDCISVDEIAAMIGPNDKLFIKMDIEGAEYDVAPMLAPLLQRERVDCFVSFHPRFAAGGHPRFHKTFAMTRRVFETFPGFALTRVGRKSLLPAGDVKLLARLGLWLFEAKRGFLFSKGRAPLR